MRCLMYAWPSRFTYGTPPARSIASGTDHDAHRPHRADDDEGQHPLDVRGIDVLLRDRAPPRDRPEPGERPVAHVEQPRLAADGQRSRTDDLHAGVLLRIVRRGHGDAAVESARADREIEHLRPDHPDVEDVGAA